MFRATTACTFSTSQFPKVVRACGALYILTWTCVREKRRVEERRAEERRSEKRKSQKKEDADARKGRKVAKHCVFPIICGSGGSKSRPAKAAGAEPAGQMGDEKLHAVLARSTFPSQNVQNTTCSDHFWKLRIEKVHAVVA